MAVVALGPKAKPATFYAALNESKDASSDVVMTEDSLHSNEHEMDCDVPHPRDNMPQPRNTFDLEKFQKFVDVSTYFLIF